MGGKRNKNTSAGPTGDAAPSAGSAPPAASSAATASAAMGYGAHEQMQDLSGERPLIVANLVVNSLANFKLSFRDTDDYASSDAVEVGPGIITKHPSLFNGRFELQFIFVTSTVLHGRDNFREVHRGGRVVIDGKHVVCLGPLQRHAGVQSAILLDEPPKTLKFEVFTSPDPIVHPSEALLADHVAAILELDEFRGSVSSSHLQNQVRELPFYASVIEKVRPSWVDFVNSHPDKWRPFKYTQEEVDSHGLKSTCRAKELRLYAVANEEFYQEGDIKREEVRSKAETELNQLLLDKLDQRPYEQSELLEELVDEPAFLTLIALNLVKILGMFEAHPDKYFVLCHPLHPILVATRRHDGALTSTQRGGGLVYDRVKRRLLLPGEVPTQNRSSAVHASVVPSSANAAASAAARQMGN